ncbi:ribosome biogenesis GTP-binding protein YihA/YsxC [Rubneribacter sp.]|nr:ribosome biogenesis GTP-binding protein YihA/YsxC [Candidatus Rubneribacter avistercoris]
MNINNVAFERSFGISSQLPPSTMPEVAFAGRSNVGKSSLLNKLFNRKSLAKVSQTPGKTSTINFFTCEGVRFVDLPGYGYAKVSKAEKGRWSELIEGYFNQERDMALVISLIDIRHPASDLDVSMVSFLQETGLPFAVALTKADKISNQQRQRQKAAVKRQLGLDADVPIIACSSAKGVGIDELRKLIAKAVER